MHHEPGNGTDLTEHVGEPGVLTPLTPLTLSPVTAVLALLPAASARHGPSTRRDRRSPGAAGGAGTLTAIAKGLAVPAPALAAPTAAAHRAGAPHW
ncbi:hypothetical protein [Streptomyces sp. NPDC017202]|uniref:hypothetical protein n=1 Tax=Streptomyces sp. NPDC017202 TaxID=3364981 RepID=UPI0037880CA1